MPHRAGGVMNGAHEARRADRPGAAAGLSGPADSRRVLFAIAVLALPFVVVLGGLFTWWWCNTTETFGPVAHRDGWVAFEQQVDHAWPLDRECSVWLGRSIEEPGSWHRLAPADAVRVQSFTWVTPKHLRIAASRAAAPDWVTKVEDIAIEWTR
jgi:hypothetical protein